MTEHKSEPSTATDLTSILIAGGGLAAVRTAQALRDFGYGGELLLVSAETHPPYDRPPLSKDFLKSNFPLDGLDLLPPEQYAERGIGLRLNDAVVALDPAANVVHTAGGKSLSFDALVIATGAQARTLDHLPILSRMVSLRSRTDAETLREAIARQGRIVVLGGGFVGLEVAASARTAGCPVTVIEAQPAPLVGILGPTLAEWLQGRHQAEGVDFRCDTTVLSAQDSVDGLGLTLSDGSQLTADLLVVGVGITRDLAWVAAGGLEIHLGLVCDEQGRTSRPGVYGAGDVVCQHVEDECQQIQHWTAATLSARRTAQAILGIDKPVPAEDAFFWSDQYGLRIQFAGRAGVGVNFEVVSGSLAEGHFTGRFLRDGSTSGVLAVNQAKEFLRLRMALRQGVDV